MQKKKLRKILDLKILTHTQKKNSCQEIVIFQTTYTEKNVKKCKISKSLQEKRCK